jgi:SMC interacting uncharacterized protein involved in chromosome segregation
MPTYTGKGYIGNRIAGYTKTSKGKIIKKGQKVFIDFTDAFTWTIIGKRGKGKSYGANVLIEEILEQNPTLGVLVIDIMGLYFSLKYPNLKDGNPSPELRGWEKDVQPKGYADRVRVLVPEGFKHCYPLKKDGSPSYDGVIGIRPSQLTTQNWLDALDLDINKPQGQVLSIFVERIKKETSGNFTIAQLVRLIQDIVTIDETPEEEQNELALNVMDEITFSSRTIEALQAKIMATRTWGIFSKNGLKLHELIVPGIVTVLDLSWHEIPDSVGALLVGFLTERLFALRKMKSLEAMHQEIGEDINYLGDDTDLPPPVLVVEEAQNYLGTGRDKKFSIGSFKKYILMGRQALCSSILVTQQPQNLDTSPLAQINGVITFNLSHEKDIKTTKGIIPCNVPPKWADSLRALEIGEAFIAFSDKSEMVKVKVRPRRSIHLARTKSTKIIDLKTLPKPPNVKEIFPEETEIDPIEPPAPVNSFQEQGQVEKLTTQLTTAEMKNRHIKELANEEIEKLQDDLTKYKQQLEQLTAENMQLDQRNQSLQDRIDKLLEDIKELQVLTDSIKVDELNGIIIAKFDEERGHIADYANTTKNVTDILCRELARTAIGFGEAIDFQKYSTKHDPPIHCFAKRYSRKVEDARGGSTLYALVIFTTDENLDFANEYIGSIVKEILGVDEVTQRQIIDKYYSRCFFTSSELRKAVVAYQKEAEIRKKRFEMIIKKKDAFNNSMKTLLLEARSERNELRRQVANLSEFLKLDDPIMRNAIIEDEKSRIVKLSQELAEVKRRLEESKEVHEIDLDKAKNEILKMDREIEALQYRLDLEQTFEAEPVDFEQISSQTQAQVQQAPPQLKDFLASDTFRKAIVNVIDNERKPLIEENTDLKEALKVYKKAVSEARQIILNLQDKRDQQVAQAEMKAKRTYDLAKNYEVEISLLKKQLKDYTSPISVNTAEQKQGFKDLLPAHIFRDFNKEFLPEQIAKAVQGFKKELTSLEPLAHRIMSILESVDARLGVENLDNLIMDKNWKTIRIRLDKLEKKNLVIKTKKGNRVYFRSGLRQKVLTAFRPFKAALSDTEMSQCYLEVRSVLEIRHLPLPHPKNGTLDGAVN